MRCGASTAAGPTAATQFALRWLATCRRPDARRDSWWSPVAVERHRRSLGLFDWAAQRFIPEPLESARPACLLRLVQADSAHSASRRIVLNLARARTLAPNPLRRTAPTAACFAVVVHFVTTVVYDGAAAVTAALDALMLSHTALAGFGTSSTLPRHLDNSSSHCQELVNSSLLLGWQIWDP